ncbi:MAG: UDP-2,3-diacylglucosamine diphosphatase [Kiritimatiellia bacterium]
MWPASSSAAQAPLHAAEAAVVSAHLPCHCRTIWLSDVHLGWRASEAERLLDFLKNHDADNWYLVGDMVDGWALKRSWYWPQVHNDIVQKLLRKVRKGARVVCIPGNHDEFLRNFASHEFGGITIQTEVYHTTATGRRLWVLHGDAFDSVIQFAPWLTSIGNNGYDAMILVGRQINRLRRWCGAREWSLSAFVKGSVKDIVRFVSDYEHALVREARRRGVDGVVCGHIHKAEMCCVDGIDYYNTGDWVENCTAIVENDDGRMEIVRWPVVANERKNA